MSKKNVAPRVVVISGTTSGIGKELAALYRKNGDTVIGLSRRETEFSDDIAVDVTDFDGVSRAVKGIAEKHGRIDIVIANAGAGLSGATELLPLEAIERQTDLNYLGAVNLVKSALEFMGAGSKVVFISSACALFPLPFRATYCASKAAVNMAAFGMYMELKDHGIRVCSICPGDIRTEFTKNRVKYSEGGARYGDKPAASANKIDSREHKRMELMRSAKKIYKCANSCKKPLYIIGFKYKMLWFLRRFLPQKVLLDVTAKLF